MSPTFGEKTRREFRFSEALADTDRDVRDEAKSSLEALDPST
jgi:hypothetical protein